MVFRVVFQNQSQIQTSAHRDTQLAKSELQKKKKTNSEAASKTSN